MTNTCPQAAELETPPLAPAGPTGIGADPEPQPEAAEADPDGDIADLEERESLIHSENDDAGSECSRAPSAAEEVAAPAAARGRGKGRGRGRDAGSEAEGGAARKAAVAPQQAARKRLLMAPRRRPNTSGSTSISTTSRCARRSMASRCRLYPQGLMAWALRASHGSGSSALMRQ